jgi:hypothetical protein
MRFNRRHRPRAATAVVIAGTVIAAAASVGLAGPSATADTEPTVPVPAEEAMLWGVFYGVGPVAEQDPTLVLYHLTDATPENLQLIADTIADADQQTGFVAWFQVAMTSGDPGAAQDAACFAWDRLASTLVLTDALAINGVPVDPCLESTDDEGDDPQTRGKPQGIDPRFDHWVERAGESPPPT